MKEHYKSDFDIEENSDILNSVASVMAPRRDKF